MENSGVGHGYIQIKQLLRYLIRGGGVNLPTIFCQFGIRPGLWVNWKKIFDNAMAKILKFAGENW